VAGALALAAMSNVAGYTSAAAAPSSHEARGVTSYPTGFFADARPDTAFDMIGRLPGFTFDPGLQVRGFAGSAGNVIVDGQRPVTKQDPLDAVLKRIPAAEVERIDVIRGAASGIDMQGHTVIANIIRRKRVQRRLVVSPAMDYLSSHGQLAPSLELEGSRAFEGRTLEGSLSIASNFDDGLGPGPHSHFDSPASTAAGKCTPLCTGELSAKTNWFQGKATLAFSTPFAKGNLKVNGLLAEDDQLDREHDDFMPAGHDDRARNVQDVSTAELGADFTRDLDARTTVEAVLVQQLKRTRSTSRFTAFEDDRFKENDLLAESVARGVLRRSLLDSLTVEGSAEGAYNRQTTRASLTADGTDIPLGANNTISEARFEGSGKATWTPSDQWTLEAGAKVEASTICSRGDVDHQETLIYPKPRVVLTWSPDANDQVRLRGEREVSQLDFMDFTASSALNTNGTVRLGNPELRPQDAWVVEAALEHRFWSRGDATLTLRRLDISDAIDRVFDPVLGFDKAGNIGRASEFDIVLDLTVPLDRLGISNGLLKINDAWRLSQATDPTTHQKRPLTKLRPNEGEIDFTQDFPRLKMDWGVVVGLRWTETYYRYNEIDFIKRGAYWSFFGEYKPSEKLSFRAEINNPTDRPYRLDATTFSGPRPAPLQSYDTRTEFTGLELHFSIRRTFD
jgi:outer membrane receptor protein involved in Fe transport